MQCRICGSNSFKDVNLGSYKLSQCFSNEEAVARNSQEFEYTIYQCIECSHIQLQHLHPSLCRNKNEFEVYDLRLKSVEPEPPKRRAFCQNPIDIRSYFRHVWDAIILEKKKNI